MGGNSSLNKISEKNFVVCVGGPLKKKFGKKICDLLRVAGLFLPWLESQKKIPGKFFVIFYNRLIYSSSYNLLEGYMSEERKEKKERRL
jgi:hypothetical protein